MNQLIVDTIDLGSFGLVIERFVDRFSPPAKQWDTYDDPTTPGEKIATIRRGGRAFTLTGWIKGPTPDQAQQNLDTISLILNRRDVLDVEFGDRPGGSIPATLRRLQATPRPAESLIGLYDVTIEFFAAQQPFFVDDSLTTVPSVTTSPVELPMGTADIIDIVIAIAGPATDPEITVRDAVANVVATLAFTLTVDGGEFLVLDLRRKTAYLNTTGLPNEGDSRIGTEYWPGGPGNDWFVLRAAWRDPVLALFPMAEISSGTGQFRYRITSEV